MQNTTIPFFGEKISGANYASRPGAYGILANDNGEICIVSAPHGYTLPGGGKDPGESDEETLKREVLEETGYEIEIISHLGFGNTYCLDKETGKFFIKEGSYFKCRVNGDKLNDGEEDHIVHWLEPRDALEKIQTKVHANTWMLEQYISQC